MKIKQTRTQQYAKLTRFHVKQGKGIYYFPVDYCVEYNNVDKKQRNDAVQSETNTAAPTIIFPDKPMQESLHK